MFTGRKRAANKRKRDIRIKTKAKLNKRKNNNKIVNTFKRKLNIK